MPSLKKDRGHETLVWAGGDPTFWAILPPKRNAGVAPAQTPRVMRRVVCPRSCAARSNRAAWSRQHNGPSA